MTAELEQVPEEINHAKMGIIIPLFKIQKFQYQKIKKKKKKTYCHHPIICKGA
jgi:hypothetical protein